MTGSNPARLTVSDLPGRIVYEDIVAGGANGSVEGRHHVMLPSGASGVFLVSLYQEDGIRTRRVVILK